MAPTNGTQIRHTGDRTGDEAERLHWAEAARTNRRQAELAERAAIRSQQEGDAAAASLRRRLAAVYRELAENAERLASVAGYGAPIAPPAVRRDPLPWRT
jgi:hypothetical protein